MSLFKYFLFSLFVCSIAVAAPQKSQTPEILSYKALMALSPAKRAFYLQGLREMIAGLERTMHSKLSKHADNSRLKDYVALMEKILPQAQAEVSADSLTSTEYPISKDGFWACRASGLAFYDMVGTCIRMDPERQKKNDFRMVTCGGSDKRIRDSKVNDDAAYCIPSSSWQALPQERQTELQSPTWTATQRSWLSHITNLFNNQGQQAVLGGLDEDSQIRRLDGTDLIRETLPPFPERGTKALGSASATAGKVTFQTTQKLGPGDTERADKCINVEDKCPKPDSDQYKKAKAEYKALPANLQTVCMKGASFSTFAGQPGDDNCQNIQSIGEGPSAKKLCQTPALAMVADAAGHPTPDMSAQAKQTLCQVGLFCKIDGSALCASGDGDAIANCQQEQKSVGAVDCFTRATGYPIADEWNKYRKQVWDLCLKPDLTEDFVKANPGRYQGIEINSKEKKFRALYCSNCRTAGILLAKLNKAVTGNSCGDYSGDSLTPDAVKGHGDAVTTQ
jgi:hypothetical protein